jgi:hypothetical protein
VIVGRAGAARAGYVIVLFTLLVITHNVCQLSSSFFDTTYQKQLFISFSSTQPTQLSSASFFTIKQSNITAHYHRSRRSPSQKKLQTRYHHLAFSHHTFHPLKHLPSHSGRRSHSHTNHQKHYHRFTFHQHASNPSEHHRTPQP